jgi:hypothetical protein
MAPPPEPADTDMDLTFDDTDSLTPAATATVQLWRTPERDNTSSIHVPQHNDCNGNRGRSVRQRT